MGEPMSELFSTGNAIEQANQIYFFFFSHRQCQFADRLTVQQFLRSQRPMGFARYLVFVLWGLLRRQTRWLVGFEPVMAGSRGLGTQQLRPAGK